MNNFRSTVGTGLLTLPIAFQQVGYIGGTIGVLFIMVITNYCAIVLARIFVDYFNYFIGINNNAYPNNVPLSNLKLI